MKKKTGIKIDKHIARTVESVFVVTSIVSLMFCLALSVYIFLSIFVIPVFSFNSGTVEQIIESNNNVFIVIFICFVIMSVSGIILNCMEKKRQKNELIQD